VRIALLHPFSWPTVRRGGERYAHDLAWWLGTQGHDVDFITSAREDSFDTFEGTRMVRLAPKPMRLVDRRGWTGLDSYARAVVPWLKSNAYDVVHSLTPSGVMAARKCRRPVVYSVIGHPHTMRKKTRKDDRVVLARACRAANVTTALSASAATAAAEMFDVPTRVISPGIRPDVFSPNLRPRHGVPSLLFAADVADHRKRFSVVLEAMPMVLNSLPNTRLVVGGPGAIPEGIDPQVRKVLDTPGVGSFDDVVRRFRSAHLTILPSVDEAFGLVLVESMACGTPVVAVRSGGMPEIVTPEVGRLAEPDDPGSLALAILEAVALAENPATPAVCADHASQWTWDVVGPQHLAAYDDAIRTAR
jgi:phosphatidylinositol alpha-mannosyltransferase